MLRQPEDVAPHQRLPPGKPYFADAEAHSGLRDAVQLLQRQHLRPRYELHVFSHAVHTAEVAAVGNRQAQVVDPALEGVDQMSWDAGGHVSSVLFAASSL